jgi:hypothetical protein
MILSFIFAVSVAGLVAAYAVTMWIDVRRATREVE